MPFLVDVQLTMVANPGGVALSCEKAHSGLHMSMQGLGLPAYWKVAWVRT